MLLILHQAHLRAPSDPAQIYQTYADQQCPSAEAGRAKAERIAAYHGIPIDTACMPADLATYANGTVVPYCWDAQPDWSAYRCAGRPYPTAPGMLRGLVPTTLGTIGRR